MKKVNIGVAGAAGKMGRAIIQAIYNNPNALLTAALESENCQYLNRDAGELIGIKTDVQIINDLKKFCDSCEVIIDFSAVEATLKLVEFIAKKSKNSNKIVIGTTGFSVDQKNNIQKLAQKTAIVLSPNMSIGVNILFKIAAIVSNIIGNEYDIEIVEAHHNKKKDSPSGTAMRLAEVIAEQINYDISKTAVYGRQGLIGARKKQEIGILALRAGDIVGEHTVTFAGPGERIELTHRAHSRDTFANGAVNAAVWLNAKTKGLFSMADVLNIKL